MLEQSTLDYTNPRVLQTLIECKDRDYYLIDVRSEEEYSSGHIPGAHSIPYLRLPSDVPTANKRALIILYCHSGARSQYAKCLLEDAGYENVVNFGRVDSWPHGLILGPSPN